MGKVTGHLAPARHGEGCPGGNGPGGAPRVPVDDVMRIFLRKPGFLLNRIDQIANALYGMQPGAGETLAQAEMLLAIEAGGESDQVSLARACGIDTSTTAIILDNLAMTGLITREQDEKDRRRSLPVLTPEGRDRMANVHRAFAALQEDLLSGLDGSGRADLTELLRIVAGTGGDSAPRWDVDASPFADAPSVLFRRVLQICHAQFNACVAPVTVTLRQFSALIILHLHPGLSQVEFARVYGLDPSTCAIVLKKLAARGLLQAVRSPADRRKTLYSTTSAGCDQAALIQPEADRSELLSLGVLTPRDHDRLLPLLQAIVRRHSQRLRYPGCLPWDD